MNGRKQLISSALEVGDGEFLALQAAASVRRRRAARNTLSAGFVVCAIAAFVVLTRPNALNVSEEVPLRNAPDFEVISDQELIEQMKDQPVMFVKSDNKITRLVFLDEPATSTSGSLR